MLNPVVHRATVTLPQISKAYFHGQQEEMPFVSSQEWSRGPETSLTWSLMELIAVFKRDLQFKKSADFFLLSVSFFIFEFSLDNERS